MAPQPEIGGDFPETSTASSGITNCHVWLPEGNRSSTIQNDDSIGVEWDINGIDDIIYIYTWWLSHSEGGWIEILYGEITWEYCRILIEHGDLMGYEGDT